MQTSDHSITWTVRSSADLGRTIAGVRAARHMTQDELAELLGVHRSYLGKIEAGAGPVFVERALRALGRMGATVTVSLPQDDGSQD